MTCRSCEIILSAQLEGEATTSQWREAEQHLATCRVCAQLWEEFQASTTLLKTQLARLEPSTALWEKISARIEIEPRASWSERWREQWEHWTQRTWSGVPRLVFGAGFAVAVLVLFFFIQRQSSPIAHLPQPPRADSTGFVARLPKEKLPRLEKDEKEHALRVRLARNVAAHFEATRLVLLEVKNNAEAPQAFDVAEVRAASQKLLEQSLLLKAELHEGQVPLLRSTLEQLEVVLFELANLETQPEPEEISSLRTAIQHGDLLIKIEIIDLEALTRKAKERPPAPKPQARTAKSVI